jgi:hypothetical protein
MRPLAAAQDVGMAAPLGHTVGAQQSVNEIALWWPKTCADRCRGSTVVKGI